MSVPITSVTEGRVTVTANDTEANIRQAAGFTAPAESEPAEPAEKADTPDTPAPAEKDEATDRNPDGTFKAKAADKPAEPAKPEGDPRKSYQAKINQAIAKQREAERRAEEAERRAQEREAEIARYVKPAAEQIAKETASPTPTARYLAEVQRYQAEPDAPKYEEFVAAGLDDPYTAHQVAMAAYVADRRLEEREAKQAETAKQREAEASLGTSMTLAAERHPEFSSLIAADTRVYPPAVLEHLKVEASLDPSLSAELFHHLLTHPDDAERLATMAHPIAAAREIGRLIAGLSSAPSGPETAPSHTNAKPLIKPVRTSVVAPEASPPEDLPFGPRYIAAMNEKERKAREARRA